MVPAHKPIADELTLPGTNRRLEDIVLRVRRKAIAHRKRVERLRECAGRHQPTNTPKSLSLIVTADSNLPFFSALVEFLKIRVISRPYVGTIFDVLISCVSVYHSFCIALVLAHAILLYPGLILRLYMHIFIYVSYVCRHDNAPFRL
jgi:hypothetical protein